MHHAKEFNDFCFHIYVCLQACRYGSMLRYKTCTSLPTFIGEWSLATDNCMGFLQVTYTLLIRNLFTVRYLHFPLRCSKVLSFVLFQSAFQLVLCFVPFTNVSTHRKEQQRHIYFLFEERGGRGKEYELGD